MARAKTAQIRKMLTEGVKNRQELLAATEGGRDHPRIRNIRNHSGAEMTIMEAVLKALDGDLTTLEIHTKAESEG